MNKKKGYIFFGIIFYILLLTVTGIYIKMVSNYEAKVTVVYASKDIESKTVIKDDMLTEKSISLSSAHKLSAKSKNEVIGKKATVNITSGEMVLKNKFTDQDNVDTISPKNKNNRLFTVEFKPDQVNGWVLKKDQLVDIIFVPNENKANDSMLNIPKQPNTKQKEDSVVDQSNTANTGYDNKSVLRLVNIRVAGVINDVGKIIDPEKPEGAPKLISFEVTTDQDEFLAWCKANGRIEISTVNEG